MKIFFLCLLTVCALTTAAQNTKKEETNVVDDKVEGSSVTLDEVIVKGARVIQKVDGSIRLNNSWRIPPMDTLC